MNLNDFNGTCYYEFASGKFEDWDQCWNENSVYLTEESIIVFKDILKKINSKWDPYDCVYFDKDQILKLENELKNKIEELKNNINILTNFTKEHYIVYKEYIINMLEDLYTWLKMNIKNDLTIIGL